MTFIEFKTCAVKYRWVNETICPDDSMYELYTSWIFKTWCSSIQTKNITYTKENKFLTPKKCSVNEVIELQKINEQLCKSYKTQIKLNQLKEDFI